jgi:hypothetical protein
VNYEALLADLMWWGERVRIRWAQSYWGHQPADSDKPVEVEAL